MTNRQDSPLRTDLRTIVVPGRRRPFRVVVDEIGGTFTRVSEHVWNVLREGGCDQGIWHQAHAVGWTRTRRATPVRRASPLSLRLRLGSIDRLATYLCDVSGWIFGTRAILVWIAVIVFAFVLMLSRWTAWDASLGGLQQFLQRADPVSLGLIFAATKVAHELGHAVMCRRMGARCGDVGVLFLCGVPCPYCDVTDIWRQPSAVRRAAVMLAGIYVELIMAAIAAFVWMLSSDPWIQFHAMNLMLICGVSTIIFNANPLMRYDGYYVLADWIGSANLRLEAQQAFASVVTARVAGKGYRGAVGIGARAIGLACYHVASSVYRMVVIVAIAALLLSWADAVRLRMPMVVVLVVMVLLIVKRLVSRVVNIARGVDRWRHVPMFRRWIISGLLVGMPVSVMLVPFQRYRTTHGWLDATNAVPVFLPQDGMIEQVYAELGDTVRRGQVLVQLDQEALRLQHARVQGELQTARLRGQLARRKIDDANVADHWRTLQASESSLEAQLANVDKRLSESLIQAPVDGVVIPPHAVTHVEAIGVAGVSLKQRRGSASQSYQSWCRISANPSRTAVFVVDARDRATIDIGSPVRIRLSREPNRVIASTVTDVSAIERDDTSLMRTAAYRVMCPIPSNSNAEHPESELAQDPNDVLPWIGTPCSGVFVMPRRTLMEDLLVWLHQWIGG